MKEQPEARAVILGEYIVRQKATVRAAAEWFGVSKSTVHKDVSERLEQIQPDLYTQVKEILEQNKQERHIRGGLATKRKYALRRQHEEESLQQNTPRNRLRSRICQEKTVPKKLCNFGTVLCLLLPPIMI